MQQEIVCQAIETKTKQKHPEVQRLPSTRAHNTKSPRGLCNGFTSGIKASEFSTVLVCRG